MILKYIPLTLITGERSTTYVPPAASFRTGSTGSTVNPPNIIPSNFLPDYYAYTIPELHFRLNIHMIRAVDSLQVTWQFFNNLEMTELELLYAYEYLPPVTWAVDEAMYTQPKTYKLDTNLRDVNSTLDYKILGVSYIVPHKKN